MKNDCSVIFVGVTFCLRRTVYMYCCAKTGIYFLNDAGKIASALDNVRASTKETTSSRQLFLSTTTWKREITQ